ncbi:hypothetical protein F4777DRAFT_369981 [Nemania sp. FL0916]|nr:hypothetical protein F4777DRAFT_369981 [Nemania sp. FL0916]
MSYISGTWTWYCCNCAAGPHNYNITDRCSECPHRCGNHCTFQKVNIPSVTRDTGETTHNRDSQSRRPSSLLDSASKNPSKLSRQTSEVRHEQHFLAQSIEPNDEETFTASFSLPKKKKREYSHHHDDVARHPRTQTIGTSSVIDTDQAMYSNIEWLFSNERTTLDSTNIAESAPGMPNMDLLAIEQDSSLMHLSEPNLDDLNSQLQSLSLQHLTSQCSVILRVWDEFRKCATSDGRQNESSSFSTTYNENRGQQVSTSPNKRSRQEPSDSDDEEDNLQKSRVIRPRAADAKSSCFLACPFYMLNPYIYSSPCAQFKAGDISKIGTHLRTVHIGEYTCKKCCKSFENAQQEALHACLPTGGPTVSGIKIPKTKGVNPKERWYQIWRDLFPTMDEPDTPWWSKTPAREQDVLSTLKKAQERCLDLQNDKDVTDFTTTVIPEWDISPPEHLPDLRKYFQMRRPPEIHSDSNLSAPKRLNIAEPLATDAQPSELTVNAHQRPPENGECDREPNEPPNRQEHVVNEQRGSNAQLSSGTEGSESTDQMSLAATQANTSISIILLSREATPLSSVDFDDSCAVEDALDTKEQMNDFPVNTLENEFILGIGDRQIEDEQAHERLSRIENSPFVNNAGQTVLLGANHLCDPTYPIDAGYEMVEPLQTFLTEPYSWSDTLADCNWDEWDDWEASFPDQFFK